MNLPLQTEEKETETHISTTIPKGENIMQLNKPMGQVVRKSGESSNNQKVVLRTLKTNLNFERENTEKQNNMLNRKRQTKSNKCKALISPQPYSTKQERKQQPNIYKIKRRERLQPNEPNLPKKNHTNRNSKFKKLRDLNANVRCSGRLNWQKKTHQTRRKLETPNKCKHDNT